MASDVNSIYWPGQLVKQEPLRIPLPTPLEEHDDEDLDGLRITGRIFLYVECKHRHKHAENGAITHSVWCPKYARFREVARPPVRKGV